MARSCSSRSILAGAARIGLCAATLCAGAAALLGCSAFQAPLTCPARGGTSWVEVQSEHFTLQTDLSVPNAKDTLVDFEKSFQAFSKLLFRSANPPTDRTRVVIFDRKADYDEVGPAESIAFFTTLDFDARPWIVMQGDFSGGARHTFQHELTHRFVRYFIPRAPIWLKEGLAELFETMRFSGDEVVIGEGTLPGAVYQRMNSPAARRCGLDIENMPSATDLLTASPEVFRDKKKQSFYYAGSWLFVSMLVNGPRDYPARFWRFVHGMADGALAQDAWTANFVDVDAEDLNRELYEFTCAQRTSVRRAPFEPGPMKIGQARVMSDSAVHILWAKLLLGHGAVDKGRAEVEEALRQYPDSGEAHYVMGHVNNRMGKRSAAEEDFRFAIEVDPEEARYAQALAEVIFHREMARPKGERDLSRADAPMRRLAAMARSAPALNTVGWYFAMIEKPDEGLPFAQRAVEASPECWQCIDTLALLTSQQGHAGRAVELQRLVLSLMPESASFDDVITRLRRYEEAAAGAGRRELDRAGATKAFDEAAKQAARCKQPDGPTGASQVTVTIEPSGSASMVELDAPFGGTPVGDCVAEILHAAVRVAPFEGPAVTLRKRISIE